MRNISKHQLTNSRNANWAADKVIFWIVKKQELPSSHARAYAHTNRRLRFFAVTSVTLYLQITHNQRNTDYTQVYFNNSVIKPLKRRNFGNAKYIGTTSIFVYFSSFISSPFYHECDTCDSKKTKSLLECAHATRARTPTREKLHLPYPICSTYSHNLLHCLSHHSTNIAPNNTSQCLLIAQKINIPTRHNIFYREFPRFNPNRSLDSEQISLDCWEMVDCECKGVAGHVENEWATRCQ